MAATQNVEQPSTRSRRRWARGPARPQYLHVEDVDKVMTMMIALMAEVSALRDRLATHEALAERGDGATTDRVEAYQLSTEERAVRESRRQGMLKRVLRVVTEEREAAATDILND